MDSRPAAEQSQVEGTHAAAADLGGPGASTNVRLMNLTGEVVTVNVPPTVSNILELRSFLLDHPDLTASLSLKAVNPVSLSLLRFHEDDELALQDGDVWPPRLDEGEEADDVLLRILVRGDFRYLVLTALKGWTRLRIKKRREYCSERGTVWVKNGDEEAMVAWLAESSQQLLNEDQDTMTLFNFCERSSRDGAKDIGSALHEMRVPSHHFTEAFVSYLASRPRLRAAELLDFVNFTRVLIGHMEEWNYCEAHEAAVLARATVDLLLRQEPSDVAAFLRSLHANPRSAEFCTDNQAPVLYHFLRHRKLPRLGRYRVGRILDYGSFSLLREFLVALPVPVEVLEFTNYRADTMLLAILDYAPSFVFDLADYVVSLKISCSVWEVNSFQGAGIRPKMQRFSG